jgi:hypothetical protein
MFYGDTIQETRQLFFSSWEHYQQKKPLSALEQQLVRVILDHPEYQSIIDNRNRFQEHSYYPEFGETNPFLHMGLHLAVREQVATNRPTGVTELFKQLLAKYKEALTVEHFIMEQLAECLWLSQKNNLPPDEQQYLNNLSQLKND